MFRAVLSDAKTWTYIVDALSTLVDEANFVAKPDGLSMRAMDPSHVAMVDFALPSDAFDEYECDQETLLGVNLDEMKKVMRRARSGDTLEMIYEEAERRLKLKLKGKTVRTFSIHLLDITAEELPEPSVEFKAFAIITADALQEAVKDAVVTSDHVKIIIHPDKVTFRAVGDLGEVVVEMGKDSEALLDVQTSEEASATYTLNYLADMMKVAKAADTVKLQLSTDMPLRIDFNLPGGGRVSYFLAPRIEGE